VKGEYTLCAPPAPQTARHMQQSSEVRRLLRRGMSQDPLPILRWPSLDDTRPILEEWQQCLCIPGGPKVYTEG
jgi:hypothetical protein